MGHPVGAQEDGNSAGGHNDDLMEDRLNAEELQKKENVEDQEFDEGTQENIEDQESDDSLILVRMDPAEQVPHHSPVHHTVVEVPPPAIVNPERTEENLPSWIQMAWGGQFSHDTPNIREACRLHVLDTVSTLR